MSESKGTPWAPSQHEGMRCACHHWDARECWYSRYPDERPGIAPAGHIEQRWDMQPGGDERCDCMCHDRDVDEDDEY